MPSQSPCGPGCNSCRQQDDALQGGAEEEQCCSIALSERQNPAMFGAPGTSTLHSVAAMAAMGRLVGQSGCVVDGSAAPPRRRRRWMRRHCWSLVSGRLQHGAIMTGGCAVTACACLCEPCCCPAECCLDGTREGGDGDRAATCSQVCACAVRPPPPARMLRNAAEERLSISSPPTRRAGVVGQRRLPLLFGRS